MNSKYKKEKIQVSVILPCRNEEKALAKCIIEIQETFKKNKIKGEIIVSDSSIDNSPNIAKSLGVNLIKHDKIGYGRAFLEAIPFTKGEYIFFADADGTYNFQEIPNFIKKLKNGSDLVIGNRFSGRMSKNAMPFLHKYLGNPILSAIMRLFFKVNIKDAHCGMRAITKKSLDKLNLQTTGMEFASEMIVQAKKKNLKISQLPIEYRIREGESKLKTFSDGWRHLRFMLLYSPLFLFFIPGLIFFMLGSLTLGLLYFDLIRILGIQLQYHPMFFSSALIVIGYQLIIFSIFSKSYAQNHLQQKSQMIRNISRYFTLERTILIGLCIALISLGIYLKILLNWVYSGFGALNEIKNSIIALTLLVIGIQTIFSAFMLSILSIKQIHNSQ